MNLKHYLLLGAIVLLPWLLYAWYSRSVNKNDAHQYATAVTPPSLPKSHSQPPATPLQNSLDEPANTQHPSSHPHQSSLPAASNDDPPSSSLPQLPTEENSKIHPSPRLPASSTLPADQTSSPRGADDKRESEVPRSSPNSVTPAHNSSPAVGDGSGAARSSPAGDADGKEDSTISSSPPIDTVSPIGPYNPKMKVSEVNVYADHNNSGSKFYAFATFISMKTLISIRIIKYDDAIFTIQFGPEPYKFVMTTIEIPKIMYRSFLLLYISTDHEYAINPILIYKGEEIDGKIDTYYTESLVGSENPYCVEGHIIPFHDNKSHYYWRVQFPDTFNQQEILKRGKALTTRPVSQSGSLIGLFTNEFDKINEGILVSRFYKMDLDFYNMLEVEII